MNGLERLNGGLPTPVDRFEGQKFFGMVLEFVLATV